MTDDLVKNFDIAVEEHKAETNGEAKNPKFSLTFHYPDEHTEVEWFECLPPVSVALGHTRDLSVSGITTHSMINYIASVLKDNASFDEEGRLVRSDKERFLDAMRDNKRVVHFVALMDIGTWLIRTYSARPTLPLSGSAGGRQATGDGSKEELSETELSS